MQKFSFNELLENFDSSKRKQHAYLVTFLVGSIGRASQGAMGEEEIKGKARVLARNLHGKVMQKRWKNRTWQELTKDPTEKAWLEREALQVK